MNLLLPCSCLQCTEQYKTRVLCQVSERPHVEKGQHSRGTNRAVQGRKFSSHWKQGLPDIKYVHWGKRENFFMRTGRLLHLVYMGRSFTVTRKEGSSQSAFTAEAKCEQPEVEGAQELCQRFQERLRAPCGRGTQHYSEEWKQPRNMRKSCFKQPETKTLPGFWMANSARALLTSHPKEQRVGLVLCYPSAFIHLCTIFPLVSFKSPALLYILPCWPGTWTRVATALCM